MKEGDLPLESGETVRLSLGGSFLDPFQTLCCIRNEAEKSTKIFKIVASGLSLACRICISNGGRRHFLELINDLETRVSTKMPDLV